MPTNKTNDSQELFLVVAQPSTTKIRESQDLSLLVTQPTTAKVRLSHDVTLVVAQFVRAGTAASTLRHLTVFGTNIVVTGTAASSLRHLTASGTGTIPGKIQDSQDLALVVSKPTTTKIRESQDLSLVVSQPTTAKIRASHEVILVVSQRVISGIGASTLRHLTASATGSVPDNGIGSASLRHLTVAASGQVTDVGTAAVTLRHLTVFGLASQPVTGSIAVTLSPLAVGGAVQLRPNVFSAAVGPYEILQSFKINKPFASESHASLTAAKTGALEVIQHLRVGSDSGLYGLFEDDLLTPDGDLFQKEAFDTDIPITFLRGSNFEALRKLSGGSSLVEESLQTGTSAVSQTAIIIFEAVAGRSSQRAVVYELATGSLHSIASIPLEQLAALIARQPTPSVFVFRPGIFDDDFGFDQDLDKGSAFDDEFTNALSSSTAVTFPAGMFDNNAVGIDNELLVTGSFDGDILTSEIPANTHGAVFESGANKTATTEAIINYEALAGLKNKSDSFLSSPDPDKDPVIVPGTGTGAADHIFNPVAPTSSPSSVKRRRRREQS